MTKPVKTEEESSSFSSFFGSSTPPAQDPISKASSGSGSFSSFAQQRQSALLGHPAVGGPVSSGSLGAFDRPQLSFDITPDPYQASHSPTGQPLQQAVNNGEQQRVNVDAAREALRIAHSIRTTNADTLNQLDAQGQQLVRIEAHLDNMSANLDRSATLIRGMESIFSYIGNKFGKNKKPPPVVDYGLDKPPVGKKIEKLIPPLDIEILCKNPDDSFTPALLRFQTLGFCCIHPETGQTLTSAYTWNYEDVDTVVIRARHEHADIKFSKPSLPRFRLMSSYLQLIVNELALRCKVIDQDGTETHSLKVVWEPGVRRFEFDDPALTRIPTTSRAAQTSGFSRYESTIATSSLLSATADQETRDAINEVDSHLDEISAVVGDIGDMAVAMGRELEAHNEHLERIQAKAEENDSKLQSHTARMNKLMS